MRQLSGLDQFLSEAGNALLALRTPPDLIRAHPAEDVQDGEMNVAQKQKSAALMRVNHAGEVAAQGLYQGQALSARGTAVREHLTAAAKEEAAHLHWCADRLQELDSRVSYLTPLWHWGSVAMGLLAGAMGDRYSLGFVEETERQVEAHLQSHLERLPEADVRSRAIVAQMQQDEVRHRQQAREAGSVPLPASVCAGMRMTARLMTGTAYWV